MMRTLMAFAAAIAIAACSGEEATSAPTSDDAQASPQGSPAAGGAEIQLAQADSGVSAATQNLLESERYLEENGAKEGVVTTASGLQYKVLSSGPADGVSPTPGQWVCVHYRGTFANGEEFDSSYSRNEGTAFPSDGVIPGWVEALSMMKPGDAWQVAIHPDLAYGPQGVGPIAPNTALLFDVELIRLMAGPPARGTDCATDGRTELEFGEDFLAENATADGVVTTPSGLQYKIQTSGPADGASPTLGQFVCVNYRGTFLDGEEFDSSYSRNEAMAFPTDGVISGWTEALSLMKPGDTWQLAIPSGLAYGSAGVGPIPPDSVLLFDVELIKLLDGPPTGDCAA